MKDQGKTSELNKSSHRYQSSKTVGRKSETYSPQAFLSVKFGNQDTVMENACAATPGQGLQRTKSRNARRRRANQRRLEERIAALPPDASPEEYARVHDPKAYDLLQVANQRRAARQRRHENYVEFMRRYNKRYATNLWLSKKTHDYFCSIYCEDEPFIVRSEDLEKLHTIVGSNVVAVGDLKPSVNFDHFPNALPKTEEYSLSNPNRQLSPPQLGMPDYVPHPQVEDNLPMVHEEPIRAQHVWDSPPQMGMPGFEEYRYGPQAGTISDSCATSCKEVVSTCLSDVYHVMEDVAATSVKASTPLLDYCGLPNELSTLVHHLISCKKPLHTFAATLALYVICRFLTDFYGLVRYLVRLVIPCCANTNKFHYGAYTPQSGQIEPTAEVPEGELEIPSAPTPTDSASASTPTIARPVMPSHYIMESVRAQTTRDIQNWRKNPTLYPLPRDILNRGIAFPAVLQSQIHDALKYKPTQKYTFGCGAGIKELR